MIDKRGGACYNYCSFSTRDGFSCGEKEVMLFERRKSPSYIGAVSHFLGFSCSSADCAALFLRQDIFHPVPIIGVDAGAAAAALVACRPLLPGVAAAAKKADIVITILPADPEIEEFLLNQTFSDSLKPGCILVDMSSATSDCMKKLENYY